MGIIHKGCQKQNPRAHLAVFFISALKPRVVLWRSRSIETERVVGHFEEFSHFLSQQWAWEVKYKIASHK